MRRGGCVLAIVAASACGGSRTSAAPPREAVVARVGDAVITDAMIRAAAMREGVGARAALTMLVDEALLAQESRRRGLAPPWVVEDARWHASLRRYLEDVVEAPNTFAHAPPGNFDAFVEGRRASVCHDGLHKVTHAVFLAQVDGREVPRAARQQAAEALRARVVGAAGERPSPEVFQRLAGAVRTTPHRVEVLPPMDRAGRMVGGAGAVVEAFARRVWSLSPEAPLSPVFETSFGSHVALLLEVTPPSGVSCEDARPALQREFVAQRRAAVARELVERLRARAMIRVDTSALRSAEGRAPR